ncbi:MAG: hypothetical protein A3G35_02555 [candidate division NC10 bacterium RIFCSPLOWO2_12_FULL_66_18]|nr:MAG: hypothetical protein A3G35_02555 [candidate division NC10 bacterium RIFCSPLOWO2_12_FULL_66_18]
MASPIGHVVVGIGVAGAVAGGLGTDSTPALWTGAAVASCLPDLDLLPSLWGVPYRRVHRRATHSLLILAPLVGVAWAAVSALDLSMDWRLMLAWTSALMSHLVLDILCTGPGLRQGGHGIPLFWPLASRRWCVSRPMFPEVNFLEGVPAGVIGRACLRELLHLSPAAGVLILLGHLL